MKPSGTTPIFVGAGQVTQRWDGKGQPADPLSLMAEACERAFEDAGSRGLRAAVDRVAVVNVLTWSYDDPPARLSARLGLAPRETIYTSIGGNTPQCLVHDAAIALASGRCRAVLLAGGEAGASMTTAYKRGIPLDSWPPRAQPAGSGDEHTRGVSEIEQAYDLFLPSAMYPMIETALRAHAGRSPEGHAHFLGQLFARFAAVAASNPLAWFPVAHSPARIATASPDNRYVGYPYTKLMNAIIQVDQAAALVLTTEDEALRAGIGRDRWVYPMGGGELNDVWYVTERLRLYESPAIAGASEIALGQAGLRIEDIDEFDLYSCFPAAVELAQSALALPIDDPRPLTVTGGLPYFGGPGNNYSMHAIATAVGRIRNAPGKTVLVSALGWYCTKHAVGIYGSTPPAKAWASVTDPQAQAAIDGTALAPPRAEAAGHGRIEAFVIRHSRDGDPSDATALVTMDDGGRALAHLDASATELLVLEQSELVGRRARVRHDPASGRNRARVD